MASSTELIEAWTEMKNANIECGVEEPKVLVLGTQSKGKSTLVESLSGIKFNYCASDIASRCPIEYRMINNPKRRLPNWTFKSPDGTINIKDINTEKVRELVTQINQDLARDNRVDPRPLCLTVEWYNCFNFSFIDFPGLRFETGNRDPLVELIKRMLEGAISEYLQKPNTIFMFVEDATADASNTSFEPILSGIVERANAVSSAGQERVPVSFVFVYNKFDTLITEKSKSLEDKSRLMHYNRNLILRSLPADERFSSSLLIKSSIFFTSLPNSVERDSFSSASLSDLDPSFLSSHSRSLLQDLSRSSTSSSSSSSSSSLEVEETRVDQEVEGEEKELIELLAMEQSLSKHNEKSVAFVRTLENSYELEKHLGVRLLRNNLEQDLRDKMQQNLIETHKRLVEQKRKTLEKVFQLSGKDESDHVISVVFPSLSITLARSVENLFYGIVPREIYNQVASTAFDERQRLFSDGSLPSFGFSLAPPPSSSVDGDDHQPDGPRDFDPAATYRYSFENITYDAEKEIKEIMKNVTKSECPFFGGAQIRRVLFEFQAALELSTPPNLIPGSISQNFDLKDGKINDTWDNAIMSTLLKTCNETQSALGVNKDVWVMTSRIFSIISSWIDPMIFHILDQKFPGTTLAPILVEKLRESVLAYFEVRCQQFKDRIVDQIKYHICNFSFPKFLNSVAQYIASGRIRDITPLSPEETVVCWKSQATSKEDFEKETMRKLLEMIQSIVDKIKASDSQDDQRALIEKECTKVFRLQYQIGFLKVSDQIYSFFDFYFKSKIRDDLVAHVASESLRLPKRLHQEAIENNQTIQITERQTKTVERICSRLGLTLNTPSPSFF